MKGKLQKERKIQLVDKEKIVRRGISPFICGLPTGRILTHQIWTPEGEFLYQYAHPQNKPMLLLKHVN
jgi:hypothetical protein